jgi:hypothetical protein
MLRQGLSTNVVVSAVSIGWPRRRLLTNWHANTISYSAKKTMQTKIFGTPSWKKDLEQIGFWHVLIVMCKDVGFNFLTAEICLILEWCLPESD